MCSHTITFICGIESTAKDANNNLLQKIPSIRYYSSHMSLHTTVRETGNKAGETCSRCPKLILCASPQTSVRNEPGPSE